jgi:protein arginine N-methyltransferase 1
MSESQFVNASENGEIPTYKGSEKAKATDFANYFCSYAQLYHQKQMLVDHNRMAAYHHAIAGNADIFKDKVVMDVGTGSGILAAWAAQAGARKVYAVEYTDMAKHAKSVMDANGLSDIVTVIQGAVEDIELPREDFPDHDPNEPLENCVDIIISEWMGYFLLRESMLDSLVRARDKYLKKNVGLMFPSHATMYLAPVTDEDERRQSAHENNGAMGDWSEFVETTKSTYGVNMSVLSNDFEREQKEYYLLSSRWSELNPAAIMAEPQIVKTLDMHVCTVEDSRGISLGDIGSSFDFDIEGPTGAGEYSNEGPVSGLAGWFTVDFKSRTDDDGKDVCPKVSNPAFLSTGPENGYTHWGQQVFHFLSSIPMIKGDVTRLSGALEMSRTKENTRLYNCRLSYEASRRKSSEPKDGKVLMQGETVANVYQIP